MKAYAHLIAFCNPGSEKLLKAEWKIRVAPELSSGFQRPGWIAFKAPKPKSLKAWRSTLGELSRRSLYAQCVCVSVGEEVDEAAAAGGRTIDLGSDPSGKAWRGWYDTDDQVEFPRPTPPLPEDSPSRSYLKIEEAISWSGIEPKAGQVALEVGAAPGGACYSLLQRGLRVYAIDAAEMDAVLPKKFGALFTWLPGSAREVASGQIPGLPAKADWLLVDIHANAIIALRETEVFARRYAGSLRGGFFTLKLGDVRAEKEIHDLVGRFARGYAGLKPKRVFAKQLPSHHREIGLFWSL